MLTLLLDVVPVAAHLAVIEPVLAVELRDALFAFLEHEHAAALGDRARVGAAIGVLRPSITVMTSVKRGIFFLLMLAEYQIQLQYFQNLQ